MLFYNNYDYEIKRGTLYSFDYDPGLIIKDFETFLEYNDTYHTDIVCFTDCFDMFWEDYVSYYNFYFSFMVLPEWYKKVIDEFNSLFNNIRITVIKEKELNFARFKNSFDSKCFYLSEYETEEKFYSAIFHVEVSQEYRYTAQKYLKYLIHHFLRLMSLSEGFISYEKVKETPKDAVEFLLRVNDTANAYRSLCDFYICKEDFLLLDNIDLINSRIENMCPLYEDTIRQTEIMLTFLDYYNHPFRPGQLVISSLDDEDLFIVEEVRRDGRGVKLISTVTGKTSNLPDVITLIPIKETKDLSELKPAEVSHEEAE